MNRAKSTLEGSLCRVGCLVPQFADGVFGYPCCGPRKKYCIAPAEVTCFKLYFRNTQPAEIVGDLAKVDFPFCCGRTVSSGPLSQSLSQVVPVPETPVKDRGETCHPTFCLLLPECAVNNCFDGLTVAFRDRFDILGRPGSAFDLQHPGTGINYLVKETDSAKILRRHDELIVNF